LLADMSNFGASFRQARESRGISLDQIAKQTRISTRFLNAIETEDFSLLPGGIFNRGFVRAFAEAVGLNPDQAVADYERLTSVREPSDVSSSASDRPSTGERYLYPIAIGVLAVAIAIFYIVTRDSNQVSQISNEPEASLHVDSAPSSPPPPESQIHSSSPAPDSEPPAKTLQALTLDVEAREKTWIKVSTDGNSVNPGEVLEPGMTRKFTAESSFHISIGNAAGLTLKINDMPLKPLGKRGEVRFVTITPENLKDFIG
jgi:cytoskeletal protein RodZ